VRFRVSDVFLPSSEQLPTQLSQSAEMEGRIVDFSDSGLQVRVFAVVDVGGDQPVVVPVKKLHVIGQTAPENG
jgi:hypothetical protein